MATIRNGRISTTVNYNKVKAIPELGLLALVRPHSGGVPSVSSVTTPYSLELAHFVNPVRRNAVLKGDVERFLRRLGIVEARFTLNSASNLAPLRRDLHYTLDKLAFCAITCSKTTLQAMIVEVDKENNKWLLMASRRVRYARTFFLDSPPFSDAEYELVVMKPQHFLQKGQGFLVHVDKDSDGVSHKVYLAAPDGALRAGGQNTDQRLPPFTGPQARAAPDILNPFLIVINAEMAFRRFKRHPHSLCDEYTELIDLTISLVEKIYFHPLVYEIEMEREEICVQFAKDAEEDVRIGSVDKSGAKITNDKNKTINRKDAGKSSRTGRVVENPGPGASHDKIIEYHQYLMSGQDHELTSDDEDLLAELDSESDGIEEEWERSD